MARYLIACGGLLLLASIAHGGTFQRTKDGKTLVWNNLPEPGDVPSWSGKRDSSGYATGHGTLTWYRIDVTITTGSNLPSPGRRVLIGHYSGNMVRGKFEGRVVNVDASGNTFHGTFSEGRKMDDWAGGPAPPEQGDQQKTAKTSKTAKTAEVRAEKPQARPRPSPRLEHQLAIVSPEPSVIPTAPSAGRTVHETSVKEKKTGAGIAGQTSTGQRNEQKASQPKAPEAPAEGPSPRPSSEHAAIVSPEPSVISTETSFRKPVRDTFVEEKKTDTRNTGHLSTDKRDEQKISEPNAAGAATKELRPSPSPEQQLAFSSPRLSPAPVDTSVSLAPEAADQAVPNRVIAHFKEQTQSTLSRVGDATGNFREIDRLDSVQKLPAPVSESVAALIDRARDVRSELGSDAALQECRTEIQTVDGLSAVDQVTRDVAANDASQASSKLNDFLQNYPEPTADRQKDLWHYLTSLQVLFFRSEKEAEIHLQRAQSLDLASRTSEAIREYQKAYEIFPNPATAEKIRQLQDNSLGL